MAKITSGEVAKKNSRNTPVKKEMSLEKAFTIVRTCDEEIRTIYGTRIANSVNVNSQTADYNFSKGVVMFAASLPIASAAEVLFGGGSEVGGPFFALTLLTIVSTISKKMTAITSPIKRRKFQAEFDINEQLNEFHEETMADQAAKVLRKAKKPVKVINAALAPKGQSVYYCNEKGAEGFKLSSPETGDQWDLLFLRANKDEMQKEIETFRLQNKEIEEARV